MLHAIGSASLLRCRLRRRRSTLQSQLKPVFTFTRQHNFLLPVNCANFRFAENVFAEEFRLHATVTLAVFAALHFVFGTWYSVLGYSVFCVPGRLFSRQQPLALWHIIDTWPGHKAKCIDIHNHTDADADIHIHIHMHLHSDLESQHERRAAH